MSPSLQKLQNFIQHPATQLATGIIMLFSGAIEIWYDIQSTEHSFRWGVHHGVAIFGLVQVLGSLPALIDGLNRSFDAVERRQKNIES